MLVKLGEVPVGCTVTLTCGCVGKVGQHDFHVPGCRYVIGIRLCWNCAGINDREEGGMRVQFNLLRLDQARLKLNTLLVDFDDFSHLLKRRFGTVTP